MKNLTIKIDVDTDRGTRIGVPNLLKVFEKLGITATFLFSLGPDNTGRALKRIFRPGFLQKVSRTSVISTYGFRTLLNGILWPGPHIGQRNAAVMQQVRQQGHGTGIHCYDHIRWQDGLAQMTQTEVSTEFEKALKEYQRIFGNPAPTAGAAGWQANAFSLAAYDDAKLLYASDCRGQYPFFPRVNGVVYKTLQIPTTLPTLDELLGRPEYPESQLISYYLDQLQTTHTNNLTIHAEIEGMSKLGWFTEFLQEAQKQNVQFTTLEACASKLLAGPRENIPVCDMIHGTIEGRSGTMAVQVVR